MSELPRRTPVGDDPAAEDTSTNASTERSTDTSSAETESSANATPAAADDKPSDPTTPRHVDSTTTDARPNHATKEASKEASKDRSAKRRSPASALGRFVREIVVIVVIALIASALLRAFVVQAFFVPSGSMLPEIKLNDRILVSRIGDIERGEVVVFEDPGGWIPAGEQAAPPGTIRQAFEFIGVLPASGHEHLVKRVIGLPGDHVVCCGKNGLLSINGVAVDESDFLRQTGQGADNVPFDVIVPKDSIFVLGDNRYVSGDSSRHLTGQDAFIPMDLVTGRAFSVVWPLSDAHVLHIPDAYDDVPDGRNPPDEGVIKAAQPGSR